MHRFIELCVDMRKGRTAKEGLMQYKNIAQNTSVQSIESVITKFVQLADAKVLEAQEKAAVKSAVDVDDLEASETPESILLGAVSGDQSKDRTDRALVTPWLKFLWGELQDFAGDPQKQRSFGDDLPGERTPSLSGFI